MSSREIRGEAGKSMLTHYAVTFTKYTELTGERERKGNRKTDRKTERQKKKKKKAAGYKHAV